VRRAALCPQKGDQRTMEIVELRREWLGEAGDVLARAFAKDPIFAYFLPADDPNRMDHLGELCRFCCLERFELGFPPQGCLDDGHLVGVACVIDPVEKPWPASLAKAFEALAGLVGPGLMSRLEEDACMIRNLRPAQPHLYLEMLGVLPEAQGRGAGRALLDAVQAMSEAHAPSEGVALDTENPANVPLYEHVGYEVRGRDRIGPCDVWSMFRRNRGNRDAAGPADTPCLD
jgi:ribosomal protein S18 acetylase RimI-like enzyme